jgi:hypothetical protein
MPRDTHGNENILFDTEPEAQIKDDVDPRKENIQVSSGHPSYHTQ